LWSGLLDERGWSQERAAREIGVSLSAVRRWLSGETEPRYRELSKVSRALGDLPL
jgi:transcriptional regulator with XRE-family HTH domain